MWGIGIAVGTSAFVVIGSTYAMAQTRAVVADDTLDRVTVFDADTLANLGSVVIPGGATTFGDIVVSPDGTRAYASRFSTLNTVTVIDITTSPPILAGGNNPIQTTTPALDLSLSADGRYLVVSDGAAAANPITIIDTQTQTVIGTLRPDTDRSSIDVCKSGSDVFMGAASSGNVRRLTLSNTGILADTAQVLGQGSSQPNNVACAPGGTTGVVVNRGTSDLRSFSASSMAAVSTQPLPGAGLGINVVISPDGSRVFGRRATAGLAAYAFDSVTGAIGSEVWSRPTLGGRVTFFGIDQMAIHPAGTKLYVSTAGAVLVLDAGTGTQLGSFPIGNPTGIDIGGVSVAPNQPPTADAGGPYVVAEGATVLLAGSGDDPDNDEVTFAWDLDDDGVFETVGQNSEFSAVGRDGPDSQVVNLQACDPSSACAVVGTTIEITNVSPGIIDLAVSSGEIIEGDTVTLSGAILDPAADDTFSLTIDWGDGSPPETLQLAGAASLSVEHLAMEGQSIAFSRNHTYADDNQTGTPSDTNVISVSVVDDDGDTGTAEGRVVVTNAAPAITAVMGPVDPIRLGVGAATVGVTFTDLGTTDTHTCTFQWGDGTVAQVSIASGDCATSRTYDAAGVYAVQVEVADDDTGSVTAEYQYVVVYDPTGGFVTGGGWIDSPAGAYNPDPTLTGKAHFGFVSKYKPGANVPEGNTNFQFQAGKLHFQSTSYDWLVVAGQDKAKYKGTGTINGAGSYRFMLTVIDNGNSGDKFHIKIWDDNGVVYDNAASSGDDDYDGTVIGGGNIKVHKN